MFRNVSGKLLQYKATASAQPGSAITVTPKSFSVNSNALVTLTITITSTHNGGQEFGEVVLTPNKNGDPALHLPVAFVPIQGGVTLAQDCVPSVIVVDSTPSTCTITAHNDSFADATINLHTELSRQLKIASVVGGLPHQDQTIDVSTRLAGKAPGSPSIAPGASPAGYIPLDAFGVVPDPIGDEEIINYNVSPFLYDGVTYTRIGVDSNGYIVVGSGDAGDNNCCDITDLPNPARPNNVLAPLWTDLDGTGAPGVFVATLSDGVLTWIVVEWRVNVFGTTNREVMQTWIGINAVQDISFAYDPADLPSDPSGQDFRVGVENENGSAGDQLPVGVLPTEDLVVSSTPPVPGATYVLQFDALGVKKGTGVVTTRMDTPTMVGTTVKTSTIEVLK